MKHSRRYIRVKEKIEPGKIYTLPEAIAFCIAESVKFDAGVEVHMHLGIDPKKSEQVVRGTVVLPHGTGKTKRVAAFVTPEKEQEARDAGADVVGGDDLIASIKKSNRVEFDVAVAEPSVMKKLGPIAKLLGQQGLMPNPKTETVGNDIGTMVKALKTGKIAFRSDDGGNIHALVGRTSFLPENVTENIQTFYRAILRAKPPEAKGIYVQNIVLSSSMGPGIQVLLS